MWETKAAISYYDKNCLDFEQGFGIMYIVRQNKQVSLWFFAIKQTIRQKLSK
jgi:hypothetical protein